MDGRGSSVAILARDKIRRRHEHEDVAVGKVDEPQNSVNHRVAQRDEREDGAERQAVDELLEKFCHGATVSTYLNAPFLISRITAGFEALRLASMVMLPVTPGKSFSRRARRALSRCRLHRILDGIRQHHRRIIASAAMASGVS